MAEDKDVNDLNKLLDETLNDFGKRRVTDDELDDLMLNYDKQALEKTAKEFETTLQKLTEIAAKDPNVALPDPTGDAELEDFVQMMKAEFLQQDISPMVNATIEKYDALFSKEGESMSEETKERCNQQVSVLKRLSDAYARSVSTPAETEAKVEEIGTLWRELHALGDPPENLFDFSGAGMPEGFPQVPPNCSIC